MNTTQVPIVQADKAVKNNLNESHDEIGVWSAANCSAGSKSGLESATALVAESDVRLATALQSLGEALQSKRALLSQMREINHSPADLTRLAEDVAEVAAQSTLLALNAAIEAAWVGEAKRRTGASA